MTVTSWWLSSSRRCITSSRVFMSTAGSRLVEQQQARGRRRARGPERRAAAVRRKVRVCAFGRGRLFRGRSIISKALSRTSRSCQGSHHFRENAAHRHHLLDGDRKVPVNRLKLRNVAYARLPLGDGASLNPHVALVQRPPPPRIVLSSVVFPDPLGPSSPTKSPRFIVRSTSWRTGLSAVAARYGFQLDYRLCVVVMVWSRVKQIRYFRIGLRGFRPRRPGRRRSRP